MSGKLSQDEVRASGDSVTVSGTFEGTCAGLLRVDVIDRTPGSSPRGPLTVAEVPAAPTFSIVVPKGAHVALSALCDADRDGFIKGGTEDLASTGVEVGEVSEDTDGVALVLTQAGNSVEGPDGGPPPGGGPPPAGGPPPEGGPGGPPPDGERGGPPPPGAQGGTDGPSGEGPPPAGGRPPGEGQPPPE